MREYSQALIVYRATDGEAFKAFFATRRYG